MSEDTAKKEGFNIWMFIWRGIVFFAAVSALAYGVNHFFS
jgi:hypothetical protein